MAKTTVTPRALSCPADVSPGLAERVALPMAREFAARPKLSAALLRYTRWGNVFADGNSENPYAMHERIRADGPVCWNPLFQQWFITGYDEVVEALASPAMTVRGGTELVLACRPHSQMSDSARGLMRTFLLFVDAPDHPRLRRIVSRAFSPRQVARLESASVSQAAALFRTIGADPNPEMFGAFNAPFPIRVISELLGIPEDRWAWTQKLSDALAALLNPFPDFDAAEMDHTLNEALGVFDDLVQERKTNPTDDLISALVTAEDDGDRLDRYETIATIMFIMFAGHETTSGVLGNAMIGLAESPDQLALIRATPELWPNAVEEFLRWDTALQMTPRRTSVDTEIGGQPMKAGQNVILMLGAANRDPRRYDNPDALRLDREEPRSIAFGHGAHYCLGAALARMELRVGLQQFVDFVGDYRVDRSEVVMKSHAMLRGPVELPIRRTPAPPPSNERWGQTPAFVAGGRTGGPVLLWR
jgi:cytochrome P450